MKEEADERILDRVGPRDLVRERLKDGLELLREVSNYGTRLILRCWESSPKRRPDLIVIGSLLKQAVAMMDAAEVLMSHGAVYASRVPARALLESRIYIAWILQRDTESRANHYYVWDLRRQRRASAALIPGTPENEAYRNAKRVPAGAPAGVEDGRYEAIARRNRESIEKMLSDGELKAISDAFDLCKRRDGSDARWYRVAGASSIRKMAEDTNLLREYDYFYTDLSAAAHSEDLRQHVTFEGQTVVFEPIRQLEGIDTILNIVITIAASIYMSILETYRPEELRNFREKYKSEWLDRRRSITKIKYMERPGI